MKTLPVILLVAAILPNTAHSAETPSPQGVVPEQALIVASKVRALETEVQRLRVAKTNAEKELQSTQTHITANEGNDASGAEISTTTRGATLAEIDKCLAAASEKTKSIAAAIKNAQDEKALAQQRANKTGAELIAIRQEMEMVTRELANMKKRDVDHRENLKTMETKLASVTQQADSETAKLSETASELAAWEMRAKHAETDLAKTKEAMQTSLRVAADAKALGQQFQEKLTLSAARLVESDTKLASNSKALTDANAAVAKCEGEIESLKSELVTYRERSDATDNKIKSLEQAKLASERQLESVRAQLLTASDNGAELEKQVAAYKIELEAKTKEADATLKEIEALTEASKKVQDRLDDTLLKREELHDHLTILRNEFAQYRADASSSKTQFAQVSTNQLQSALVKKDRDWQALLDQRHQQINDLKQSLQAKEIALQDAYKREKSALAKVSSLETTRSAESAEHQSIRQTLDTLRRDLAASEKQACQLKDQLIELEVLATGGTE